MAVLVDHSCNRSQVGSLISSVIEDFTQGLHAHVVEVPEGWSLSTLENEVKDDPCVVYVGENHTYHNGPLRDPQINLNDTETKYLLHLNAIRANKAYKELYHAKSGAKSPVVLAVVDTGVDLQHEDLKDRLWTNPDEIPDNNLDDDNNGFVDDIHGVNTVTSTGDPSPTSTPATGRTHGTHVAGLAVASANNSKGVAGVFGSPPAKIMGIMCFL